MAALGQELALRIDHHPFAVVQLRVHQPGRGQRGLLQRDAGAGFDRVQRECGQCRHDVVRSLNFQLRISRSLWCGDGQEFFQQRRAAALPVADAQEGALQRR